MNTQAPEPGSPAWYKLVTASKVATILGLSPEQWSTPWTLWHAMKDATSGDDGRNAKGKARGHYLEDGVIRWWIDQHRDDYGSGFPQTWRPVADDDGVMWAGATSDLYGTEFYEDAGGQIRERFFVLNAKTSATTDDWWTYDVNGDPVMYPPPYYLASLMWEMWVFDAPVGYIACLFGPSLDFREWRIERDDELIAGIVTRCREFYDSLAGDEPPELDDTPATYEAVRRMHPDIDRDATVVLPGDVAFELVAATAAADAAEARRRRAHVEVMTAMGTARTAEYCGLTVARRQPNRHGVSFVPVIRDLSKLEA